MVTVHIFDGYMMRYFVFKVALSVVTVIGCFATVASGAGISSVNKDTSTRIEGSVYDSVVFTSGKHELVGKLITRAKYGSKVPVIIFAVGSGNSSYRTNYKRFLEFFFERNLPLDSVALFYFDKRGIGLSEGKWSTADFEQRAEDVKAAADYVKSLSVIDAGKIIVAGHSQGGWIAQVCMARYPEAFAAGMSMAGPTFSVKKQLINDYRSKYICAGKDTSQADIIAVRKVNTLLRVARLFPLTQQLKQLKVIRTFEAASYISSIKFPFLYMFGENDALVSPAWSHDALNSVFAQKMPSNFETITVKGVNHSFQVTGFCRSSTSGPLEYSTDAQIAVRDWALRHIF